MVVFQVLHLFTQLTGLGETHVTNDYSTIFTILGIPSNQKLVYSFMVAIMYNYKKQLNNPLLVSLLYDFSFLKCEY